jgi:hypothetical protein
MTKKWQIEAKPTWHHFGERINWFIPKKRKEKEKKSSHRKTHDLENQDAS